MEFETVAPFLFFGLGLVGRVVIPYIQAKLASQEPISFDWRYLIGQLLASFVALIPLIDNPDFLGQLGALSRVAALVFGWGSGDIGRAIQKAVAPK
jgi:hypothetical protein